MPDLISHSVNSCSCPSDLKITDMRFVDIDGAPKRCTILKIETNQRITGYGEVRDASSKTYALMLKSRILGENPCNVDKIFRKIKQFGGHSRQGGGVSGIEIALWDLAGKAYGVPLYQLLGGKFRDEIRVYCDTDVEGRHTGHDMGLALKKRLDMVPWMYTDQYVRLRNSTTIPVCTGEDIYLKESFRPLIEQGGVSVIHPDILTCGGALELKKIADMADDHGVAVAVHMAESPVGCLAAVQTAAAMNHVLALEFHSVDVPWWGDMVTGIPKPLFQNGYIQVPEKPGLGFDDLNEEVLREHIDPNIPGMWEPTDQWNQEFSNDRIWN